MSKDQPFSLLYPHAEEGRTEMQAIDQTLIQSLAADTIFNMIYQEQRFNPNRVHPLRFFTQNPEVIAYRQHIVEDLLRSESLHTLMTELVPDLEDMRELNMARRKLDRTDSSHAIYSISELEIYIDLLQKCYDFFITEQTSLHSDGMKKFAQQVIDVYEGKEFQHLKKEAEKLKTSIRHIKSITIGVNLDVELNPVEAGVVAVNDRYYQSGNIIDKLLRLNMKDDEFTCLAPLQMVKRGQSQEQIRNFRNAVQNTLGRVFQSSVSSWKPAILSYTSKSTHFMLRLVDEISFLTGAVSLLKKLESTGLPICKPETDLMENKTFQVNGMYNPVAVLRQQFSNSSFILNDLTFDEQGMVYILTGPNQGGKTVFTQAVGLAQMMFQLGLFVPARSAVMSPVDQIFTHFQQDDGSRSGHGRFGEECERLVGLFEKLTPHSLLLMDETFSSTSAAEATVIAEQLLVGLCAKGCRVLFATHLHDLARNVDRLNEDPLCAGKIDNLVAGMEEESEHSSNRSYVIRRERPKGLSYAQDIAEKYGLTLEKLLGTIGF